ncbi:MAG: putative quinol monooxygenase [Kiritimatiellia bacterium]
MRFVLGCVLLLFGAAEGVFAQATAGGAGIQATAGGAGVQAKAGEAVVILAAQIVVKESQIQAFKEICRPLIEQTRKEAGCVRYELLQNPYRPNAFFFFEEYANQAAADHHARRPYLDLFKKQRVPMLLETPTLQIYRASQTLGL